MERETERKMEGETERDSETERDPEAERETETQTDPGPELLAGGGVWPPRSGPWNLHQLP